MSLAQLTAWCDQRFGPHQAIADGSERPYDVPWLILDSSKALTATAWRPDISLHQILEEDRGAYHHPSRLADMVRSMSPASQAKFDLKLLSVVIPARDEEGCIASTVEHLHVELRLNHIAHEIVVVDDGSTDRTAAIVMASGERIQEARLVKNGPPHGFGRAIICGLKSMSGDAAVIMMADESDDCGDVVRYWNTLKQGWDAVFGSRFMKGGGVIDYPWLKLRLNRMANLFVRLLFGISLNDTTNAFKAYRRTVIEGCQPLLSAHFNLYSRNPIESHYSRLLVDGAADYLAQPAYRYGKVEKNSRDGQPLSVHLSIPVVGEASEPWGLQEGSCMKALPIRQPNCDGNDFIEDAQSICLSSGVRQDQCWVGKAFLVLGRPVRRAVFG